MKRILIAFDGSPGAGAAITDLCWAGLPRRVEARVLSVADVWLPAEGVPLADARSGAVIRQQAEKALAEAKNTAAAGARLLHASFPEWTIDSRGRADSPAWGILAEADEWRADLVAAGSHGRSPLEKFFLGSVSTKVAAEARCSVRIARPPRPSRTGAARLVLALDGSSDAESAAEEMLARSWAPGTHIELLSVIDPKIENAAAGAASGKAWMEQRFAELTAKFAALEIATTARVLEGDPKTVLLRQAAEGNADCIFLGARGLNHGNRYRLGTLASAICTRADCTVEIVRAPVKS
jgi:nucleotide-binding universal stress UspA family protein